MTVAQSALTGLAAGAIAYGTFQDLNGQPADFGVCIRRGLALVAPVIAVVLLSSLLTFVGYVAIAIPGLIIYTTLWLVVPVTVVERPGIANSLRRSSMLTKGCRWQIFGMILILAAADAGTLWSIETLAAPNETTIASFLPYFSMSLGATAVLTAFEAVVTTVTYYKLRGGQGRHRHCRDRQGLRLTRGRSADIAADVRRAAHRLPVAARSCLSLRRLPSRTCASRRPRWAV